MNMSSGLYKAKAPSYLNGAFALYNRKKFSSYRTNLQLSLPFYFFQAMSSVYQKLALKRIDFFTHTLHPFQ